MQKYFLLQLVQGQTLDFLDYIAIACQRLIFTVVVCWESQRGRNRLGWRGRSGHPRSYSGASKVWGSVHAVSVFDAPGLRVLLKVFVSGGESWLVARRVWTCCACLR